MATPQWRPVDAPDFGTAMRGLAMAGSSFTNAFDGLSGVLGKLQGARDNQGDQEVMRNMLQYTDPDAYRAALGSGAVFGGANKDRLSTGVMEALARRTGTLQGERGSDQSFKTNQYTQNRTQKQDAAEDAIGPAYQQMIGAYQRGDIPAAQALYNANKDKFGALSLNQQRNISTDSQNAERNQLSNTVSRWNLGQDQKNAADRTAANAAMQTAILNSYDPASAMREYQRISKDLGADAGAAFRQTMQQNFPGMFGPEGSGVISPSAAGTAGTRGGSVYDVTYEHKPTDTPITQQKMGDLQTMQSSMIGSQGASPLGAFQINKATMADFGEKVFGKNWRDIEFTPENQDKLGEAIFNARKNGNLKATWDALPNSSPGAYKDVSWDQVKGEIAKRETGVDLRNDVPGGANVAAQVQDQLSRRFTQDNIGQGTRQVAALEGNAASALDVAAQATGEGGIFAGADRGKIMETIQDISRRARVNPAQALEIMNQTQQGRSGISRMLSGALNSASMGLLGAPTSQATMADTQARDAMINQISSGGLLQDIQSNRNLEQSSQQLAAAQANLQMHQQALTAAQQRYATNPSPQVAAEVQRRQQALMQALEIARATNVGTGTADSNVPLSDAPRAVQRPPVILMEPPAASPQRSTNNTEVKQALERIGRSSGRNW